MTKLRYNTLEQNCKDVILSALETVNGLIAEEADIAGAEVGESGYDLENWIEKWFDDEYEKIIDMLITMMEGLR